MTRYSLSERDLEQLSAYLDGELSDRERLTLEQRLRDDSELRQALDDLRSAVRLVGALPRLKAPRSFALDPAVYGARAPWWRRWLRSGATLQWSGALGTAASVILIALGFALGTGDKDESQEAQAPAVTITASPAPAAASLPTPQPTASQPAPLLEGAPLAAEGADTADSAAPAESEAAAPTEAPAGPTLAAPQAGPSAPLGDAAAEPFAGAQAFAPPATISPDAALRAAPPAENFRAQEFAAEGEADRGQREELAAATPTPATQEPTASAAQAAAGDDEASSAAASRKDTAPDETSEAQREESRPRWRLVGVGAVGLAISAALWIAGRRQTGA